MRTCCGSHHMTRSPREWRQPWPLGSCDSCYGQLVHGCTIAPPCPESFASWFVWWRPEPLHVVSFLETQRGKPETSCGFFSSGLQHEKWYRAETLALLRQHERKRGKPTRGNYQEITTCMLLIIAKPGSHKKVAYLVV